MHFPTDRTTRMTAFDEPVIDHWLERKIAYTANAITVEDRSGDPNHYRWVLYRLSYIWLQDGLLNANRNTYLYKVLSMGDTCLVSCWSCVSL